MYIVNMLVPKLVHTRHRFSDLISVFWIENFKINK